MPRAFLTFVLLFVPFFHRHPTEPLLVTVSWDGRVVAWAPNLTGVQREGEGQREGEAEGGRGRGGREAGRETEGELDCF